MAIVDVVTCQTDGTKFAEKFFSDDLRIGTQLVVSTAQTAFLVKGGVIYDQFPPGTYTISTQNIPLLNEVLNIPFGNESPFKAEVWFIHLINKLDCKWGTLTPIQLEDPKYGVIVPIRAYGQYGIKICRPKFFLTTLVGNLTEYSIDKVGAYFKGKIMSSLTSLISQKMVLENMSVLEINAHLDELSAFCQGKLDFKNFGIDIVNFYFMSINFPEDDLSIVKLKEAKDIAARMKITGKDVYQMERSFNVMEAAANNEGGGMAAMGAGLGTGLGVGGQMGSMFAQNMNTNPAASQMPLTPPPPPSAACYFVLIDGQQAGPYPPNELKKLALNGKINRNTHVWKQGMADWDIVENVTELKSILSAVPPPPPTITN